MRIAHFSDIHILELGRLNPLAFLGKRLVGGLNLWLNRAPEYSQAVVEALVADVNALGSDHVIVSGDLTNLSLLSEFRRARQILEQLDAAPSRVTVIPGNHDCYTVGAGWAQPFHSVFADWLGCDLLPSEAHAFPQVRLVGDIAVIGLSTARPSAPLLAIGSLGRAQRGRLSRVLQHPEVCSRVRLVAMHHPPRSDHGHWHNRLTDSAKFCQMIRKNGADLIVHGHLHRTCRDRIRGPNGGQVPVVGVNSGAWLCPKDPTRRPSYNIYDLAVGKPVQILRRDYDVNTGRFADGPAELLG